jgi:NhaP-type Na+/H+ or K+/H+ antiporter
MAADLLLVVSVVLLLGAVARLLAVRYGVPNVVFLLGFGVLVGPEGLGFLLVSLSDAQLSAVVGFAVAIIVFEGAFSLSLDDVSSVPRPTLYLVTVGSLLTFVGMGLAIRGLVGVTWNIAFLVSALLVATGPTVVTPILEQVSVRENLGLLLKTEGIVNDPVASVLGAVVFSATLAASRGPSARESATDVVVDFVTQISVGVVLGIVAAVVVGGVLRRYSESPQDARIVVLAAAPVTYAVASTFATEAGVVAVAVAGLLLGTVGVPHEREIAGFSGDVTSIVLSVVYVVLAALIEFEALLALGLGGALVVLVAMVVVRPAAVLVSTVGSSFTRDEKLFVSAVGPRGIVPAATATLFSIELAAANVPDATSVVSLVFLVILVTVVLEAGGAPQLARMLNVVPMTILIVGGSEIGRRLADDLAAQGDDPFIVERDERTVEALRARNYAVVHGNGTYVDVLEEAGADRAAMLVATTRDDATNILACQTARTAFGTETLVSLVNDESNAASFRDLGVRTVTPTRATTNAIEELVVLPSLSQWRERPDREETFREVTVRSDELVGERLGDVELPDQVVVVVVQRADDYLVPSDDLVVRAGDRVTLFGRSGAVEEAVELFEG